MIKINNKSYKLCLFDTNALSSFLQKPKQWIYYFDDNFSLANTIICYSVFTLSELFYRSELFEKYIEIFSTFPSAILDGHESIFQKEIRNYKTNNKISPIIVVPFSIKAKGLTPKEKLSKVIYESGFVPKTEYWKKNQEAVLNGIMKLKSNYLPKKDKYSIKEIEEFVFIASTNQIGIRDKQFAKNIIDSEQIIDLECFLSLKSTSYFVFYKFYPDKRNPINSDIFDIIISSLLPYVDYFITEGNMFEIIRKIQNNHNFLRDLKPYSIRTVNKEINRL